MLECELELEQLLHRFGPHGATLLWTFAFGGRTALICGAAQPASKNAAQRCNAYFS